MGLAKGRIFKRDCVIFAAKTWARKFFNFQFTEFYVFFMTLQSIGFKFFAKIMKGSCVFCCSSCVSFNPTSHLDIRMNCLEIINYKRCYQVICSTSYILSTQLFFLVIYLIKNLSNNIHVLKTVYFCKKNWVKNKVKIPS